MKNLLEALANEGQSPCQKFSCPNFQRCADEKLACFAFGYFVETGRTVHPHIFPVNNGLSNVGEVHPTRKWFDDIEHDRLGEDNGGGGWDQKRIGKAQELVSATIAEAGNRGGHNWFGLTKERAEATLQRAAEREGAA